MASILVVDRDATHREPTGHLLRVAGYDVLRAATGADGLELLDSCPIDLILVDSRLPEMDGFAFVEKMRNGPHKDLPVVMMTPSGDEQTVSRLAEMGIDKYLVKPQFSSETLLEVVGQCLA